MTEEEPSVVDRLADPDSLLGMLQRGRGKGYLLALEKPPEEVWPLLIECVTNDPRMDPVCEERDYPSLILATGMDLEPLRSHLKQNDRADTSPTCTLGITLGTLAPLATDGNSQAIEILREYVSFGRKWMEIVLVLGDLDVPSVLEGIGDTLYRRISSEPSVTAEFTNAVERDWKWYCESDQDRRTNSGFLLPVCEPWKTLCDRNSHFASLFGELGIVYDPAPPLLEKAPEVDAAELSVEEILFLVDESNVVRFKRCLLDKVCIEDEEFLLQHVSSDNRYRVILAFEGLGHIGTPKAFQVIKSYIEASKDADRYVRAHAFRAIIAMPAHLTLETARIWFRGGESHLHIPAGNILEQHATFDDIPMLIEALRIPEIFRCEDFRLSSALEALALFDGIGPIPELETVFCEVAHCFQRYRAAVAMEITAPLHFQHHYAFECLWDCHDDTRELGCDTVNLTIPGALERLKELAEDEGEYDNVREAAQKRLEGF